ncbi:DUF6907 domain-containing protein [Streptomyces sp. NPDC127117]|uniref:DUF6907 domain-containing protein n=1 Tax=Streptomyces sp. NPDC127117 TaxID=3345368 RepID=UPI003639F296
MTTVRETTDTPQAKPIVGTRTWARVVGSTGYLVETCPEFCTDDHDSDQTAIGVDDLNHGFCFTGPEFPVFDADQGTALVPILGGRVQFDPYSRDPRRRRPHMHFEPFQDEVMECLTPDEFARIIATIREHCDQLDAVYSRFAQIHAAWTEQA